MIMKSRLYFHSSLTYPLVIGFFGLLAATIYFQFENISAPYVLWGLLEAKMSQSLVIILPVTAGISAILQVLAHRPEHLTTAGGTRVSAQSQSVFTLVVWTGLSLAAVVIGLLPSVVKAVATATYGQPNLLFYVAVLVSLVFFSLVGHLAGYLLRNPIASVIAVAFALVCVIAAAGETPLWGVIPYFDVVKSPSASYSSVFIGHLVGSGALLTILALAITYSSSKIRVRGLAISALSLLLLPVAVGACAAPVVGQTPDRFDRVDVTSSDQVCRMIGQRNVCLHKSNELEFPRIERSLNAIDQVIGESKVGFYEMRDFALVDTFTPLPFGVGAVEFSPGQGSRFGALLIEAASGVLACSDGRPEESMSTSLAINDWLLQAIPVKFRESYDGNPEPRSFSDYSDEFMLEQFAEYGDDIMRCNYVLPDSEKKQN